MIIHDYSFFFYKMVFFGISVSLFLFVFYFFVLFIIDFLQCFVIDLLRYVLLLTISFFAVFALVVQIKYYSLVYYKFETLDVSIIIGLSNV